MRKDWPATGRTQSWLYHLSPCCSRYQFDIQMDTAPGLEAQSSTLSFWVLCFSCTVSKDIYIYLGRSIFNLDVQRDAFQNQPCADSFNFLRIIIPANSGFRTQQTCLSFLERTSLRSPSVCASFRVVSSVYSYIIRTGIQMIKMSFSCTLSTRKHPEA